MYNNNKPPTPASISTPTVGDQSLVPSCAVNDLHNLVSASTPTNLTSSVSLEAIYAFTGGTLQSDPQSIGLCYLHCCFSILITVISSSTPANSATPKSGIVPSHANNSTSKFLTVLFPSTPLTSYVAPTFLSMLCAVYLASFFDYVSTQ